MARSTSTMKSQYCAGAVSLLLFALPVCGAGITILPNEITLTGPSATQRLIVLSIDAGKITGDLTDQAKFTSSNPAVATVNETGFVRAAADGSAVITASCGGKGSTAKVTVVKSHEPLTWSFRNHVIPMMTKVGCNSGACHGALAGKGGFKLSLRGYAPELDHFVMTRQALGRRVDSVEPAHSLVLLKPTMTIPHGGGQRIEVGSPDYKTLTEWIAAGAPPPKEEDVRLQRLEVIPTEAILKPKDSLQILVRGWYSDGHSEDVTRWGKFTSTEDLVATVDQEGKARVTGRGEAAITIWYSNLVAVSRITSPLANSLQPMVFAVATRHNYVDDLVLNKLERLHIPPSPPCRDSEFMRRLYLDTAGILPAADEVRKFLADKSPDKRTRLIEALLERPEYVDYWAYKWSDLLLLSTRKLSQSAMWAFYQYLRQSVADNKPWDRFAREILTAHGSTLEQGAANYFVLHKDVSDLTESTALTFLGMSITCCRCHNHPLEKWTQDQYWSMANLFSRVAIKSGDRGGELTVQSLSRGDVMHPRRGIPMPPTPLDGKPLADDSMVDRRQYFADWLTSSGNPYFAKALVNRVWRNFMGRALVEAEDDFRQTNPPTNAELLDRLAKDFIEHQYDVKHLIRTIVKSAAYERSSAPLPGNAADDRFYSHYLIRRLPAEVILDAYSDITGVASQFAIFFDGKPVFNFSPGTRSLQLPDVRIASQFLDSFGRPERVQTCSCERQQDSSVTQALHLNNGQTLNDKLRAKGSRIERWVKDKTDDEQSIRQLFLMALCREPSPGEVQKFKELMTGAAQDKNTSRRQVLEDLFWALLTGREFLFNH
jgi:hypothetical protein